MRIEFLRRKNFMAKKKPADRAYEFSVEELAAVVRQLTNAAELFEECRVIADKTPTKTLVAHNRLTLERALTNLKSSVGAMQKAVWLYRVGTPLEPGQLKPQSPWRKKDNGKPNGKPNKN
jgi:hypothetical protein